MAFTWVGNNFGISGGPATPMTLKGVYGSSKACTIGMLLRYGSTLTTINYLYPNLKPSTFRTVGYADQAVSAASTGRTDYVKVIKIQPGDILECSCYGTKSAGFTKGTVKASTTTAVSVNWAKGGLTYTGTLHVYDVNTTNSTCQVIIPTANLFGF